MKNFMYSLMAVLVAASIAMPVVAEETVPAADSSQPVVTDGAAPVMEKVDESKLDQTAPITSTEEKKDEKGTEMPAEEVAH